MGNGIFDRRIFGTELSARNVQHGSIENKEFSARKCSAPNEIQRKMLSQLHKTNCL